MTGVTDVIGNIGCDPGCAALLSTTMHSEETFTLSLC